MFARLMAVVAALTLSACAALSPPMSAPEPRPLVLLVSIDGFRPDYLDRGVTPTLSRLAAEGATGPMQPSFPSKTFPNHYTLVTGLRPDHHGIVNNTMEDPAIPGVTFRLSDKAAVTDRRWWDDGEPVWVTAENAGLHTATLFWPGSEADIHGVRPERWLPFDQTMTGDARVDQFLAWLDDPAAARPDFGTLYFDIVDTAGHRSGPDSPEVDAAVASVDASMARLLAGLRARGLADQVVLVVVADHGMAATAPERSIPLGPVTASDAAHVVFAGAILGVDPVPGHEAAVRAELLAPHDHMQCWERGHLPPRLAFGTHRRVPAIFCLAETGWEIVWPDQKGWSGGDHGYDNAAPEMQALFIAHGPGVARGARIEGLRNVDVHALLGRLLGIAVPADDGDPRLAATVLVP
ncbi:ectonucleotide pyrophosphatase/phosphodiesterase [uncultured Brevundimonas sp.]|uniref:alkaline phosphatase family protein n=1 Tax=uncultured Brevundimonas sp. TaxID=213418 RepID=UPI0030EB5843|tara:strand:- start:2176 stop:3399 length:1224 start_codon:yes stop_codon:yes gene_type:complete